MNPNELIQRYLHGEATDAEVAELDRLLASDRALRRKLIVEIGIDAGLCEIARERASQPSVVAPRRSIWLSWRPLTAAAACAALLVGGGLWWQTTQRVLATVVNDAGVEELSNGAMLKGETHSLKGGSVELITSRGARIVIEAPAVFRFESAQRLRMMSGRLSAEVPPAAKGETSVTALAG